MIQVKKICFFINLDPVTRISFQPVHEVSKIPPRHCTAIPMAHVTLVVLAEQLHAHHSKDEDDDTENKRQVGQGSHGVHHDGQDVIEGLP